MEKDKLFASLEAQHRLPSGLLNAVMMQESRGNANAVSPKGAQGYFQFMPATAKQYNVNPSDLTSSATGAARMYADLLKQNNGDLNMALAGYNWGQGNLSRKGLDKAPKETRDYIAKVKQGMGGSGSMGGGGEMAEEWVVEEPQANSEEWVVGESPQETQKTSKAVTPKSDRFIQGVRDPFDGIAQLLSKIPAVNDTQDFIVKNIAKIAYPELAETINGMEVPTVDKALETRAKEYKSPDGVDWARLGGNILSPANLAVASKVPHAATLGGRVLAGAGLGGALGAMSPVENGNYAETKAKQIGLNAALGGALPVVTGAIGRVVSPKASTNQNVQLLRNEGVNPTIGQTLGGRFNAAEEKLKSLPILGDMITNARNKANSQFEVAAYNRALTPIGQKLPQGLSGREALLYTENTLKDNYDDVLTKIGAIKPDQQFASNVNNLVGMVKKQVMPNAEKAKFATALNDVKQSIDSKGVITSDAFKALESSLGADARKLGNSTNIYESRLSPAVKQLQTELRDMLKRQAGDKADDLLAANTAWANFKRVQDAASKLGADEGKFSPAQLQNAVKSMGKNKAQFARGKALMQDLGDAGKSVLTNKVADSGTAGRLLMGGGALASGAYNPAIPIGLIGGSALYTQPVQKFLNTMATLRPQAAPELAQIIKNSAPYLTPAALGLLN